MHACQDGRWGDVLASWLAKVHVQHVIWHKSHAGPGYHARVHLRCCNKVPLKIHAMTCKEVVITSSTDAHVLAAAQVEASIDLQASHSWPKMGLPRVRSREDARKRTLLRKEKQENAEKEREQSKDKPRSRKSTAACTDTKAKFTAAAAVAAFAPVEAAKHPAEKLQIAAEVLEGVGAIPHTPEKVY